MIHPPHFLLQSLPRSGSIMLGRMLDGHPQLRCFGEIFSVKPVHLRSRGFADAPLSIAARCAHFGARAAPRRWGFRAHVYHGVAEYDPTLFTDFWSTLGPGVRVVHLIRENLFHRYVSHRVARLTDQWFVRAGAPAPIARVTLRLSPAEVAEDCERMAAWQEVGRRRFPGALTLRYEDLRRDPAGAVRAVLRYLDIDDSTPPPPATVRLARAVRETVENYDELERHFAGSRWARFFVD